ncbi:MAG: ParB/RepB/Spo0J family partition protein, partial [Halomonadaceae bacterium]|nr:ParB/RepB/Spo0J family partition protein [Halomonadaceae bacterium]
MSGKGKFGGFMQALESIESIDNTESPQPISEAQKTGSMHQPNRNDPYSQSILHQGRSRIKSLEAEIEKYKDLVDNGRLEQDIKITQIDRPPLVMRSEHYWSTPRFKEIKESIRRKGLHEPITVRPSPDKKGRYLLVKGDTRLTSHEHLREETGDDQWDTIRARIEVIDDRMSILKMVVENRDRADVSAYDQACFFTQVLNSICDGDRASAMELLDIDKATMSRSVTISKLPRNVMDTFVSLFEAGGRSLY